MISTSPSPIAIVGAGLGGLTLGLCLQRKGIATVIYDRATSSTRYNYGITLYPSSYRPLLSLLHMDEATFRNKLAVDARQGGSGRMANKGSSQVDAFRCHRGSLETLIGTELAISRGRKLKHVQLDAQSKEITAVFDGGDSLKTKCLVGCDGPHSMTRQSLCSAMKLHVLPYVVFNGRRRISISEYMEDLHRYMHDNVIIVTQKGDVRLGISLSNFADSHVDISYTYSRPARRSGPSLDSDPLHSPNRPNADATNIPDEFYEELAMLQNLEPPFKAIFNPAKVREDRILHWLMRTVKPDLNEAKWLADRGVLLIGDAIHATPILGGEGANTAIRDGIELAEYIASKGVDKWAEFTESRYEMWAESVRDSERKLEEMHTPKIPHL